MALPALSRGCCCSRIPSSPSQLPREEHHTLATSHLPCRSLCVSDLTCIPRVNPGNPVAVGMKLNMPTSLVHFRLCLLLKHPQSAVAATAMACPHLVLYLGCPPLRSLATPWKGVLNPKAYVTRNYNYNHFPIFFSLFFFLLSPLLSTVSQAGPSGSRLIK